MTRFKTLYKDYFIKDTATSVHHFELHRKAEQWAKENNITIRYGDVYVFANVYEFEDDETLLAFTLKFGELME